MYVLGVISFSNQSTIFFLNEGPIHFYWLEPHKIQDGNHGVMKYLNSYGIDLHNNATWLLTVFKYKYIFFTRSIISGSQNLNIAAEIQDGDQNSMNLRNQKCVTLTTFDIIVFPRNTQLPGQIKCIRFI
jgi:hypothetical protein